MVLRPDTRSGERAYRIAAVVPVARTQQSINNLIIGVIDRTKDIRGVSVSIRLRQCFPSAVRAGVVNYTHERAFAGTNLLQAAYLDPVPHEQGLPCDGVLHIL